MITVLLILHLMIAASLVGVVLLQRSEGGALGIGGGGGGFMTGRGAANFLTRVTAGLAAAFFATSILLTLLATRTERAPSVFDTPASAPAKSAPAVPGPEVPGPAAQPGPTEPASPRGGVLDKLSPPAPSGPRVPQSQ
jgi:preprotein translocase subunit SecG